MSVNIQTPNGLVKISGDKVTKQNIDIALGYTLPNVKDHVENEQVHVTAGEKVLWSNKSDFSGSYSDLTDKPNIDDNESGDLQIADPNGKVIAKVNADGITTTEVTVNGKQVSVHIEDTEKHITPGDRVLWNNKSDFSGNYADLEGEPESDSDKLEIVDGSGNILARFDENGLTVTDVVIDGNSVKAHEDRIAELEHLVVGPAEEDDPISIPIRDKLTKNINDLNELSAQVETHLSAENTHFSGQYEDLSGKPAIAEDESGELVIADNTGNILARFDANGLRLTKLTLGVNENVDVQDKLDSIDRLLLEIGDTREVESEFVSNYTFNANGTATAPVESHMFEIFYIYPEYQNTYNVTVTYEEWAGTVCEQRILAENTGTHIVTISHKDGSPVIESEFSTLVKVVEHVKTGFSVYFNKLHRIIQSHENGIDEGNITFDTTVIVRQE